MGWALWGGLVAAQGWVPQGLTPGEPTALWKDPQAGVCFKAGMGIDWCALRCGAAAQSISVLHPFKRLLVQTLPVPPLHLTKADPASEIRALFFFKLN